MRIAIFSDTFPPHIDGVASVACQSARELAVRGHEVFVFAPKYEQGKNESPETPENFKIIRIGSFPVWAYPGHRWAWPLGASLRDFRRRKIDVIHAHTPFTVGWEAVRAAKIFKVPIVGTHHTFYDHYLKYVRMDYPWARKFSWKYTVRYYDFCDRVLAPSRALADELKRYGQKKEISILPNSVDTQLFFPAGADAKVCLRKKLGISGIVLAYMGRVSYEKNIDRAIEAFALAKKEVPELIFLIVGDGPERKNLENLAARLGIGDSVVFTGFLCGQELAGALQAADIFISVSESDSFAIAVLEAMASGLPVIGADALAIPDLVKDGLNGFLVPSGGQTGKTAGRIAELAKDKGLREKMGAKARETAMGFSRAEITESLENIYQDLIKSKK